MTAPDLTPARLEQLLVAATPGPWHVDGLHTSAVIVRMSPYAWRRVAETDASTFHNPNWRADAALIALSPALAARVIELEAALRACVQAHETGRFEPAQAAYENARTALETPNAD